MTEELVKNPKSVGVSLLGAYIFHGR